MFFHVWKPGGVQYWKNANMKSDIVSLYSIHVYAQCIYRHTAPNLWVQSTAQVACRISGALIF